MIWLNDLHKETLLIVDKMVNEKKTFEEIERYLYDNNYCFRVNVKNGYASKTHFEICKVIYDENGFGKDEYTFVDLIKRRNGLAFWETWKIS